MTMTDKSSFEAGAPNAHGYKSSRSAGSPSAATSSSLTSLGRPGRHVMSVDTFLRALQRDVAWDFFYGTVNFDTVFGTVNHYGNVDMFAGRYNDAYRKAELDHVENFDSPMLREAFKAMLDDWTNSGYDPFASPAETDKPFGVKDGSNTEAVTRRRIAAARMVGVPGDEQIRTDENGNPINRMFADVTQEEPLVEAEPGFESEVAAFNLFAYLSRSQVTWNPSVVSICKDSLFCPTTEEYILPVIHGNDRVEWFVQLSDEIIWDVQDRDTGAVRSKVVMRAGDVAAMPADIRHQGYSPKRSMLLVWENNSADLPELIATGRRSAVPDRLLRWRGASIESLREAVENHIHDGDTVAFEGFTHLIPHAAGHEVIRQGRRDLTLVRMTPDVVYDQLIGAGCAKKMVFSWGGNPGVGSLHRFRDAVEHSWPRPLEIEEHSHAGMAARYVAGASGLPFGVLRGYVGTDLVPHTPTIAPITCPFTGETLTAVRAIELDVAVIHAQQADREGNVQLWGSSACRRRRCSPRAARS